MLAPPRTHATAGHVKGETFDFAAGTMLAEAAIEPAKGIPTMALVLAHCAASKLHLVQVRHDFAADHVARAVEIAPSTSRPDAALGVALLCRSATSSALGDFDGAIDAAGESLRIARDTFTFARAVTDLRDLATLFAGRDPPRRTRSEGPAVVNGSLRTAYGHVSAIVDALAEARSTGPEQVAKQLATDAPEAVARRPHIIGDWLGGFAYLAIELGDADRARHIINNSLALSLPAIRPGVGARLVASGERPLRSGGGAAMEAMFVRAITHQPRLLAEEVTRWS